MDFSISFVVWTTYRYFAGCCYCATSTFPNLPCCVHLLGIYENAFYNNNNNSRRSNKWENINPSVYRVPSARCCFDSSIYYCCCYYYSYDHHSIMFSPAWNGFSCADANIKYLILAIPLQQPKTFTGTSTLKLSAQITMPNLLNWFEVYCSYCTFFPH